MRLKDKVCVITGGGSGIGRATALLFADEGARLVIADKHAANAQAVAAQCASKGAQAIAVAADVASTADVKRMIAATVERFRRLDVLVNNAGYGIPGSVVETDEDAWDALMAVNVRGVFLCSKYAIPVMKTNGGGAIVNTASVVAAVGIGHRAAYCPPKGTMSRLLAASDSHYDACGSIVEGAISEKNAAQRRIVCRATSLRCWPALRPRCNTTIFPQRCEITARISCSIPWRARSPGTGAKRPNSSSPSRRDWRNPTRAASSAATGCRSPARHFSMAISSPRSPCATCTARR